MRQQRRVGGDNHDDGAAAFVTTLEIIRCGTATSRTTASAGFRKRVAHAHVGDLLTDWHAEDAQIAAVVALNEHPECVRAAGSIHDLRRRADAALESVAAHA